MASSNIEAHYPSSQFSQSITPCVAKLSSNFLGSLVALCILVCTCFTLPRLALVEMTEKVYIAPDLLTADEEKVFFKLGPANKPAFQKTKKAADATFVVVAKQSEVPRGLPSSVPVIRVDWARQCIRTRLVIERSRRWWLYENDSSQTSGKKTAIFGSEISDEEVISSSSDEENDVTFEGLTAEDAFEVKPTPFLSNKSASAIPVQKPKISTSKSTSTTTTTPKPAASTTNPSASKPSSTPKAASTPKADSTPKAASTSKAATPKTATAVSTKPTATSTPNKTPSKPTSSSTKETPSSQTTKASQTTKETTSTPSNKASSSSSQATKETPSSQAKASSTKTSSKTTATSKTSAEATSASTSTKPKATQTVITTPPENTLANRIAAKKAAAAAAAAKIKSSPTKKSKPSVSSSADNDSDSTPRKKRARTNSSSSISPFKRLQYPVRIYLSRFTPQDKLHYQNKISSSAFAGEAVVTTEVRQATHLVTCVEPGVENSRTSAVLIAIAKGIWVLSKKWLDDCIAHDEIIEPKKYEVGGSWSGASRSRRAHAADPDSLLFSGYTFNIEHTYSPLSPHAMETFGTLITAAGGKLGTPVRSDYIIVNPETNHRGFLAKGEYDTLFPSPSSSESESESESDDGSKKRKRDETSARKLFHRAAPVVTTAWLMDCIQHWKILSEDDYLFKVTPGRKREEDYEEDD